MRPHHTKNKGDLGVLHAKVDLAEKGYRLLLPLSEHEPFDLVAYKDGTFLRVQVRYRTMVNGFICVEFKSIGPTAEAITGSRSTRTQSTCSAFIAPTRGPATTSIRARAARR